MTPRTADALHIGAVRQTVLARKRQRDEVLKDQALIADCIQGLRLALRQGRSDLAQPFQDWVARRDLPLNELLTMLNQEKALHAMGVAMALRIFANLPIPSDTRDELHSALVALACRGPDDDKSVRYVADLFYFGVGGQAERRGFSQALGRGLERQTLAFVLRAVSPRYAVLLLFSDGIDLDHAKRAQCLDLLQQLLGEPKYAQEDGAENVSLLLRCLLEKWQSGQEQDEVSTTRQALLTMLTGGLAKQAVARHEAQAVFKIAGRLKQNGWVSDGDLVPVLLPLTERCDRPRDHLMEYALQGGLTEGNTAQRRGRRQLLHYRLAVNDWSASCNDDVKAYCRDARKQLRGAFARFGGLLANLPNQSPGEAARSLASASFISPEIVPVLQKALDDLGTGATDEAARLLAWKSALHHALDQGLEKMLDTEQDDVRRDYQILGFQCIRDFIEGTQALASMLPSTPPPPKRQ